MADKETDPKLEKISSAEIDELVLTEYPYPIAVNYQRMLEEKNWEKRTRECLNIFEYGVRVITLGVLNQYLIWDWDAFSELGLNRDLYKQNYLMSAWEPGCVISSWH